MVIGNSPTASLREISSGLKRHLSGAEAENWNRASCPLSVKQVAADGFSPQLDDGGIVL